MPIAACYARYSTDMQSPDSIQDQVRNCQRYADANGITVKFHYADEAQSGAINSRPEYERMLADADAGKFDTLLVDDLSRLTRNIAEGFRVIEHFVFLGIRLVSVSDQLDSESASFELTAGIKAVINATFRKDLAAKTRRGLEGKALKGMSCGGNKMYGYNLVRDTSGSHYQINETEAAVVRQIFEWFASGMTCHEITKELNLRKIPAPRGGNWSFATIYGSLDSPGPLQNRLYLGELVWGRSVWKKNPITSKQKRIFKPESEWVKVPVPHCRIIEDSLWNAVQVQLAARQEKTKPLREAGKLHGGRGPKFLFSGGLVKCACGAPYAIVAGDPNGVAIYGCTGRNKSAGVACTNKLRVKRTVLESKLLAAIKGDLLQSEYLEIFKQAAKAALAENNANTSREAIQVQSRLRELDRAISNQLNAIAAGCYSESLKQALHSAEAERDSLLAKVKAKPSLDVDAKLEKVINGYEEAVAGLDIHPRHISKARHLLRQLVGEITVTPTDKGLVATMRGHYQGLADLTQLSLGSR